MKEFREGLGQGTEDAASEAAVSVEEGYSSLEIAAESGADEAQAEDNNEGGDDAAEPDHEAAVEEEQSEDAEESKKE